MTTMDDRDYHAEALAEDTYWQDRYEDLWLDEEREHADRWVTAWDRLEAIGVVSHPEDSNMTLSDLERIAGYLG